MKQIKTAVLGCTGLVGQQFIKMLDQHPYFKVTAVYASEASAGRKYEDVVNWWVRGSVPEYAKKMIIEKIKLDSIIDHKIKIVFSALPAESAREIEVSLRANNRYVFSNASTYRMFEDIPILIPEVNVEHLNLATKQASRYGGFIVTNSNCSTAGLALALKPTVRLFTVHASIIPKWWRWTESNRRCSPHGSLLYRQLPSPLGHNADWWARRESNP